MALTPPASRNWWSEPVGRGELVWIVIAFLWGIVMFLMMVYWHLEGRQNLPSEVYRVDPAVFEEKVTAFADEFTVGEEVGIPVVAAPPGTDVFMLARLWEWWPILELEKNKSYRLHLSSMDWQHGFSIQPINVNMQIVPGYEMVLTITPDQAGEYGVVCNEYCGIGHHTMLGKIYVKE